MSKRSSIDYAGNADFFVLYQAVKNAGRDATIKEKAETQRLTRTGVHGYALVLTGEQMQALLREHDEIFTAEGEYGTRGWRGDMPYTRVLPIVEPYLIKAVPLFQRWEDFPKIGNDRSAAWEKFGCELLERITGNAFDWTGTKKRERNGYYPDGVHRDENGNVLLKMEAKGCRSVFSSKSAITVKQGRAE